MIEKRDFYIDGKWVAPLEGSEHKVINPSTEEPCTVISLGGPKDVDAAGRRGGGRHVQQAALLARE